MRDYEAVLKQARTCANRKYCDIGGNCEYYDLDVCCQGGEKDILQEAADAIEELLAAVPQWISVEERLPEFVMNNSGCVCTTKLLFRTEHKTIHIGYAIRTYHNIETVEGYECIVVDRWYDQSGDMIEDVTHWMPLPEPPKEVE